MEDRFGFRSIMVGVFAGTEFVLGPLVAIGPEPKSFYVIALFLSIFGTTVALGANYLELKKIKKEHCHR